MKKLILFFLIINVVCTLSNSLTVFNLDQSQFPRIKANFFIENSNVNTNYSINEFSVKENNSLRNVLSVTCPPQSFTPISSVLTIDVSGSMSGNGLSIAKAAANEWINTLDLSKNECAITSFDNNNYLNLDFSQDKNQLISTVNSLNSIGGTDYDQGLYNKVAGSLQITPKAKYRKVIVFLTDGLPNSNPNTSTIINEALNQNSIIYCVVLGMTCPQELKDIASQTGGKWYENIQNQDDARLIYKQILFEAQNRSFCEIEWESRYQCNNDTVKVEINYLPENLQSSLKYSVDIKNTIIFELNPINISIQKHPDGAQIDTFVTVKAINGDISVTNILSSNPSFTISPKNFTLLNGTSQKLTIKYLTEDTSYVYTKFTFVSNQCDKNFYVSYRNKTKALPVNTLKLLKPNGGEEFLVGIDTVITWEGVAKQQKCKLEYSFDYGLNWNNITDSCSNYKYIWKNIPNTPSTNCLMKISAIDEIQIDSIIFNNSGFQCLTFSNDGKYVIAGGTNKYINIWDIDNKQLLKSIFYGFSIRAIAISKDGSLIACGGDNSKICLYDFVSGALIQTFKGHSSTIRGLAITSDNNTLISSSDDATVKIWNINNGAILHNLNNHLNEVYALSLSDDDQFFVSSGVDGNVILHNTIDGTIVKQFKSNSIVHDVDISHDNTKIASGGRDSKVTIWDVASGNIDYILSDHTNNVNSVSFCADNNKILSGSWDNTVKLWDYRTGALLKTFYNNGSGVISTDFSTDQTKIACGNERGDLIIRFLDYSNTSFMTDFSDNYWSIISPEIIASDIDMQQCYINSSKDSLINDFLINNGNYNCPLDSIIFSGSNSDCFSLVSNLPPYLLHSKNKSPIEIRFKPNHIGLHTAIINIYSKSEIKQYNIIGEGINQNIQILNNIIDFGKVFKGEFKDTLNAITIKNIGTNSLNIISTKHSFPNDSDFTTLAGMAPFSLLPGQEAKMNLRFNAKSTGRTHGILEFHFANELEPAIVNLFGEGIIQEEQIPEVLLQIHDMKAKPGENVITPITLNKSVGIQYSKVTGFETLVNFNPSLLLPLDYEVCKVSDSLAFIKIDNMPISGMNGDTLKLLRFIAGLGNAEKCNLTLTYAKSVGDTSKVDVYNGEFNLLGVCTDDKARLLRLTQKSGIISINPNPAVSIATIKVVNVDEGANLLIFNSIGSVVFQQYMNLGENIVNVNLSTFSPGIYYVKLKTQHSEQTEKFMILK